jgi:hypothetical protein
MENQWEEIEDCRRTRPPAALDVRLCIHPRERVHREGHFCTVNQSDGDFDSGMCNSTDG